METPIEQIVDEEKWREMDERLKERIVSRDQELRDEIKSLNFKNEEDRCGWKWKLKEMQSEFDNAKKDYNCTMEMLREEEKRLKISSEENRDLREKEKILSYDLERTRKELQNFHEELEKSRRSNVIYVEANYQYERVVKELRVSNQEKSKEIMFLNEKMANLLAESMTQKLQLDEVNRRSYGYEVDIEQLRSELMRRMNELDEVKMDRQQIETESLSKTMELTKKLDTMNLKCQRLVTMEDNRHRQMRERKNVECELILEKTRYEMENRHLVESEKKLEKELERITNLFNDYQRTKREEMVNLKNQWSEEYDNLKKNEENYWKKMDELQSTIRSSEESVKITMKENKELICELEMANKTLKICESNKRHELRISELLDVKEVRKRFPLAMQFNEEDNILGSLKEGMRLTQILTQYQNNLLELKGEQHKRRLSERMLTDLQQYNYQKTPLLMKRKEEYNKMKMKLEKSEKNYKDFEKEFKCVQEKLENVESELKKVLKEKENVEQLNGDLSSQIQNLLNDQQEDVENSPQILQSSLNAQSKITKQFIHFKNIRELQTQNRRIIGVIREMTDNHTSEVKEAVDKTVMEWKEKNGIIMNKLENSEKKVEMLEMLKIRQHVQINQEKEKSEEYRKRWKLTSEEVVELREKSDHWSQLEERLTIIDRNLISSDKLMEMEQNKLDECKLRNELNEIKILYDTAQIDNATHEKEINELIIERNLFGEKETNFLETVKQLREEKIKIEKDILNDRQELSELRKEYEKSQISLGHYRRQYDEMQLNRDMMIEQQYHSQRSLIMKLESIESKLSSTSDEDNLKLRKEIEDVKMMMKEKEQFHHMENLQYSTTVDQLERQLIEITSINQTLSDQMKMNRISMDELKKEVEDERNESRRMLKKLNEIKLKYNEYDQIIIDGNEEMENERESKNDESDMSVCSKYKSNVTNRKSVSLFETQLIDVKKQHELLLKENRMLREKHDTIQKNLDQSIDLNKQLEEDYRLLNDSIAFQIREKDKDLVSWNEESVELRKELDDLREVTREKDVKLADFIKLNNELKCELIEKNGDDFEKDFHVSSNDDKLKYFDETMTNQSNDVEDLKEQLENMKKDNRILLENETKSNNLLFTNNMTMEELKKTLETLTLEKKELNQTVVHLENEYERELEKIRLEGENLKRSQETISKRIDGIIIELTTLREGGEMNIIGINKYEKEIDEKVEEIRCEKEGITQCLSMLLRQIEVEENYENVTRQNFRLISRLAIAEKEIEHWNSSLTSENGQTVPLTEVLQSVEDEKEELRRELSKNETIEESFKEEISQLENDYNELNRNYEEITRRNDELLRMNEELSRSNEECNRMTIHLNKNYQELMKRNERYEKNLKEIERIYKIECSSYQSETKWEDLTEKLNETNAVNMEKFKELENIKMKFSKTAQLCLHYRKNYEQEQKQRESLQKEYIILNCRNKALEHFNKTLHPDKEEKDNVDQSTTNNPLNIIPQSDDGNTTGNKRSMDEDEVDEKRSRISHDESNSTDEIDIISSDDDPLDIDESSNNTKSSENDFDLPKIVLTSNNQSHNQNNNALTTFEESDIGLTSSNIYSISSIIPSPTSASSSNLLPSTTPNSPQRHQPTIEPIQWPDSKPSNKRNPRPPNPPRRLIPRPRPFP